MYISVCWGPLRLTPSAVEQLIFPRFGFGRKSLARLGVRRRSRLDPHTYRQQDAVVAPSADVGLGDSSIERKHICDRKVCWWLVSPGACAVAAPRAVCARSTRPTRSAHRPRAHAACDSRTLPPQPQVFHGFVDTQHTTAGCSKHLHRAAPQTLCRAPCVAPAQRACAAAKARRGDIRHGNPNPPRVADDHGREASPRRDVNHAPVERVRLAGSHCHDSNHGPVCHAGHHGA